MEFPEISIIFEIPLFQSCGVDECVQVHTRNEHNILVDVVYITISWQVSCTRKQHLQLSCTNLQLSCTKYKAANFLNLPINLRNFNDFLAGVTGP